MALRRRSIKDSRGESTLFRVRAVVGFLLILLGLSTLVVRYSYLQVQRHDEFALRSENNRVKPRAIPPARGLIFDRNGVLLADNVPAFRLEVVPEQVHDIQAMLAGIRDVIPLGDDDVEAFRKQLKQNRRFDSVPLKLHLTEDEIARFAINRWRFPGLDVVPYLTRRYPYGPLFGHVIGYVGRIDADDLNRLDADRYPFFKPYASLETMLWYSFLTIVDLVADRDLVFLGDRVADGIERILDAVDEDGGLPFHAGGGHQDFGMVALLVAVLYSDAVLDLMAGEALARMKDMRYRSLGWLLEKFDRYPQEPELFDFLVSGTMSRLLVLPRCLRAEWSLARLAELDRVVEATRISVLQGAAPGVTRGILTAAFHAFQNDGVDTEALVDLLEQKAIGVVGDGN